MAGEREPRGNVSAAGPGGCLVFFPASDLREVGARHPKVPLSKTPSQGDFFIHLPDIKEMQISFLQVTFRACHRENEEVSHVFN